MTALSALSSAWTSLTLASRPLAKASDIADIQKKIDARFASLDKEIALVQLYNAWIIRITGLIVVIEVSPWLNTFFAAP